MLSSDSRSDCRDLRYMSLVNVFKITGRTVSNMWFAQYDINWLARTDTCCYKYMPGSGHKLVEPGHLDHLYWFLKLWCFVLVNVGFVGWLGNCQKVSTSPSRSSDEKVQGYDMIWWNWATLIIYVEFWKLDGSYLEGLVSDIDLVITEIPSSSKLLSGKEIQI